MLILLHGVGSHEHDLIGLSPDLDGRFLTLSLRAPHTLAPGSYAWFEVELDPVAPVIDVGQAAASLERLTEFVPQAAAHHQADADRVYVLGFSQGAIMGLALALTRPDLLAGVVAASGRTLPELFARDGPLAGKLAAADRLRSLPVLVLHGTADPVLPVHFARDTRQRLSALPVDMTYHELPMGHTLSPEALAIVRGWLTERLDRPGFPADVGTDSADLMDARGNGGEPWP